MEHQNEYKPTTLGTPIEDLKRYLENVHKQGIKPREVRMPYDFYAKLTPEQIEWAEKEFGCTLTPIKPIVFHSKPMYVDASISSDLKAKITSPKEYGMNLLKRRKNI